MGEWLDASTFLTHTYLYQKVTNAKSNEKEPMFMKRKYQTSKKCSNPKKYQLRGFQHNSSCFAKLEPQMAAALPYLQKE